VRLNQITIPCHDYAASVRFYKALGLQQIVDSPPDYARFETDAGTTLSLHRTETGPAAADVVVYFEVDDVDETVAALSAAGIDFDAGPDDQRWLWREARLTDPAGNRLCVYHAGSNRRFPPWRIRDDDPA
jgi:hydroxymethylpyrimidine/phosphomethylpyrimidine kinase